MSELYDSGTNNVFLRIPVFISDQFQKIPYPLDTTLACKLTKYEQIRLFDRGHDFFDLALILNIVYCEKFYMG